MLVLLVIFIITIPAMHQAVPIDLPQVSSQKVEDKPVVIQLALDADGRYFLDGVPAHRADLESHFAATAARNPELHLRADRGTRYEKVADILAMPRRRPASIASPSSPNPRPEHPESINPHRPESCLHESAEIPTTRPPQAIAACWRPACCCSRRAANAEESETRLGEMKVSSDADKPVQARTELGKLTEYTPISGAVVDQRQVEHLQLVNNLLELGKRVPGISHDPQHAHPRRRQALHREPHRRHARHGHQHLGLRRESTAPTSNASMSSPARPRRCMVPAPSAARSASARASHRYRFRRANLSQEAGSWGFKRSQAHVGAAASPTAASACMLIGSDMDNDGWRQSNAPGAKERGRRRQAWPHRCASLLRPTDSAPGSPWATERTALRLSLGGPDPDQCRRSGEAEERGAERRQSAQRAP
jgi:biopolymer transport protein ExbD